MADIIILNGKQIDKDRRNVVPTVPQFSFPEALNRVRDQKRWCSWKWELSNSGRWTKPPIRSMSNDHAAVNNTGTWNDLDGAMYRAKEDPTHGVGLMLKGLDGIAVIDLDNCVDEEGRIADWAQDIVDRAGSYTEASPSMTGVKIFGYVSGAKSVSNKTLRDGKAVEVFHNTARYVCVTGEQVGKHAFMSDITNLFNALCEPKTKTPEEHDDYVELLSADDVAFYREALKHLDNSDYKTWVDAGLALKRFGEAGKELWDEFSARGYDKFDAFRQDLEWRGFKPHSITIGSLIYRAKQNGFNTDYVPEAVKADRRDRRVEIVQIPDFDARTALEFIIDEQIPCGSFIIAGQRGAGKTTLLASLMTIVTWCCDSDHAMRPRVRRRVVWVTEDHEQIIRIFRAMHANGLIPSWSDLQNMIILVKARRSDPKDLASALNNVTERAMFVNSFLRGEHVAAPLVVLDTVAATLEIKDENSNSDVSRAIAGVRQAIEGASVWFVAHVAKESMNLQEARELTARGASAFESDVQGTAILAVDPDVPHQRWLVLGKKRTGVSFNEITATSALHEEVHENVWGDDTVRTHYATLEQSQEEDRIEAVEAARQAEAEERVNGDMIGLVGLLRARGGEMAKNEVAGVLRRRKSVASELIQQAIDEGAVEEVSVPASGGGGGRGRLIIRLIGYSGGSVVDSVSGRIGPD